MDMTIRNFASLSVAILILAGCGAPKQVPRPDPTSTVLQVHLSPGLSYLEAPINQCNRQNSDYDLVLIEDPQSQTKPSTADLFIRWGYLQGDHSGLDEFKKTYRLGEVHFSIIAHHDRSLPALPAHTLADIFEGEIQDWSVISTDLEPGTIQPVMYPPDHPLRRMFQTALFPHGDLSSNARIAPHPEAVINMVSEISGAVGFIPDPLRSNSVQIVSISPTQNAFVQPVWALLPEISSPHAETLLACITQSSQK